jgi:hypothetical protein
MVKELYILIDFLNSKGIISKDEFMDYYNKNSQYYFDEED